ncbi:MAG: putative rane protein [Candidatus Methanomethylophilaceae archaeon]|nr:putative rane protein [Candidatus Methanomethylophilaceae archaeon]MDI3541689.1 putative rane protein [Candidatus Methanomethylophilaceae archaeon]
MEVMTFVLLVYMTLLGAAIGSFSGLVPGIHVNTLAAILLITYPTISSLIVDLVPASIIPVMVAAVVVSASVMHSFMDFVPSIFFGAPGEEDVLSVLPGHRMLKEGKGAEAVAFSAMGSLIGATAAVTLALPIYIIMGTDGWDVLREHIPFILPSILVLLIMSERGNGAWKKRAWAIILCILSGILGIITMYGSLPATYSGFPGGGSMMPMLSGLFGLPALLISIGGGSVPVQTGSYRTAVDSGPAWKGVIAGLAVGWLPGVTSTTGAVIASMTSPEKTPERFITMVSSVGTAATVFALVTLSVTGNGRTGTMLVVADIMNKGTSGLNGQSFSLLLLCALMTAVMGYFLTVKAGVLFARFLQGKNLSKFNVAIALFLCILTIVTCGPGGLLMLLTGSILGLIPSAVGVGRVHLTGSLLLPVIAYQWGILIPNINI